MTPTPFSLALFILSPRPAAASRAVMFRESRLRPAWPCKRRWCASFMCSASQRLYFRGNWRTRGDSRAPPRRNPCAGVLVITPNAGLRSPTRRSPLIRFAALRSRYRSAQCHVSRAARAQRGRAVGHRTEARSCAWALRRAITSICCCRFLRGLISLRFGGRENIAADHAPLRARDSNCLTRRPAPSNTDAPGQAGTHDHENT